MIERKLIIGLGNPEEERKETRHNIGWMCIDKLVGDGQYIEKEYGLVFETPEAIYLKPTVGMNSSGEAVKAAMTEYEIEAKDILVIVDDLDLDFGRLRLKGKGSTRHNGLKSIEECIGTQKYDRLKFGISHDFQEGGQFDYVLSPFTENEVAQLPYLIEMVSDGIKNHYLVEPNKDKVMNVINNG